VLERIAPLLPVGTRAYEKPGVRRLYSIWVGGESRRRGVRNYNIGYADAARFARTRDLEEVYEEFETNINRYVAEFSPRLVFVHADVVGWRGRAIVLPGKSFSGKTTMVRALLEAGATYFSDEHAVFDQRGRVRPYPRRLAVRVKGARPERIVPEAAVGEAPLPVGLVVTAPYAEEAHVWRPRAQAPGETMMSLLANAIAIRNRPAPVMRALQEVASRAASWRGRRADAETAARVLLERLADW